MEEGPCVGPVAARGAAIELRPPGLKPSLVRDLRGPEGPLFHGHAYTPDFFSSLLELIVIPVVIVVVLAATLQVLCGAQGSTISRVTNLDAAIHSRELHVGATTPA